MTAVIRKPIAALGWFPTYPATEAQIIDVADAQQIALRTRLRYHYWLTECRPLSEATINAIRKKMRSVNPSDVITDVQVTEVLSDFFGFVSTPSGWSIPELDEARSVALEAGLKRRERATAGGLARAEKLRSGTSGDVGPSADF